MNVTIGAMSNSQYIAWQTGSRATPAPIIDEDTDLFALVERLMAQGHRLACIVGETEVKGTGGQTLTGVLWPGPGVLQIENGQRPLLLGKGVTE